MYSVTQGWLLGTENYSTQAIHLTVARMYSVTQGWFLGTENYSTQVIRLDGRPDVFCNPGLAPWY